jgi:ribosomal protein L11 methyltransferase
MENTLQITFHVKGEFQDILLAILTDYGFTGFEQFPDRLIACIPEIEFSEESLQFVYDNQIPFEKSVISPRNWNADWESSFEPVVIEDFCAVRASFHQPIKSTEFEIVITPKMSFGTGHHATTWQMIRLMKDLDLKGKNILDFGTGTAVLAILAEKMGASSIDAFDNDEWSIENSRENIASNNCVLIHLSKNDKIEDNKKYDVILANINKHVILSHMESIKNHLINEGVVLFSGLLLDDRDEIVSRAEEAGMRLEQVSTKDNWLALKMKG